jgi:hypothetical protein
MPKQALASFVVPGCAGVKAFKADQPMRHRVVMRLLG